MQPAIPGRARPRRVPHRRHSMPPKVDRRFDMGFEPPAPEEKNKKRKKANGLWARWENSARGTQNSFWLYAHFYLNCFPPLRFGKLGFEAGGLSRIKAWFGVGLAGAQSGASALAGLRLCTRRQP
ncbi:hypothetical protein CCP4SC76_390030 [Gammaproteobacteria bacterium]